MSVEDFVVGCLVGWLAYSYRFRLARIFHLNINAITGSGSAFSRVSEQNSKLGVLKDHVVEKKQQVKEVHADLDQVDGLIG